MLEVLKLLVEIALKVVPGAAKAGRDKRLNRIGADLFHVYVLISESLVLGEQIVDLVDTGVRVLKNRAANGDGASLYMGSGLSSAVLRQRQSLLIIADILDEHSGQLQIIDATAYRRLRLVLNRKFGVLEQLGRVTGSNHLPLIKDYNELLKLTGARENASLDVGYDAVREWMHNEVIVMPIRDPWTQEMLPHIEAAIEAGQPRQQLAAIEKELYALEKSLKETFTIQDILQNVDRRKTFYGLRDR